jgi:hypothetical protein
MALDVSIRPVTTSSEINTLIKLPWKLHADDPLWVPPLIFDVKNKFDKKHNHFFDHGEGEYFIAWKGSEPVGRITAQFDRNYDVQWGEGVGQFGWFECVDDRAVADALFGTAADWIRKQGRKKMQGPFNFNINDECGLLVDGFDTPPMFMMIHNPAYYQGLYEGHGMTKAMDMWAYRMDTTQEAPDDVKEYAEQIRARDDIIIRKWNMKEHNREMDRWLEVYNSAWEKNWGAVKMSEKEFKAHALELRFLADPDLMFMAETKDGEVMGCAFTLPNLNEYFKYLNGNVLKLFPFRWYPMIIKKRYKSCRVVTLGTKEKFRRSGVGAVFYHDTLMAAKRKGYEWGEMSWILETNDAMNRAIRNMGGEIYKTYRIYEKDI